jgi:hypothetical protein
LLACVPNLPRAGLPIAGVQEIPQRPFYCWHQKESARV